MKRLMLCAAIGCLAVMGFIGFSLAEPSMAGRNEGPPPMHVSQGKRAVHASQGSFCWARSGGALCADYFYPLKIKRRLGVTPGGRVAFHTHLPAADRVTAWLIRVKPNDDIKYLEKLKPERVAGKPQLWRAELPGDLGPANVIDINVNAPAGSANYWAGIRERAGA